MKLFTNLFAEMLSSSVGVMSLIVIALILVMAGYFTLVFMGKVKLGDAPKDQAVEASSAPTGAGTASTAPSSTGA